MYAIVKTGGKQYRVEKGQHLDVELLGSEEDQEKKSLNLEPVLVVDGKKVIFGASNLKKYKIKAKILEAVKGPKINGFTYKSSSNQRRRYGHRQKYSRIEVTEIKSQEPKKTTATKPTTKKSTPEK